MARATYTNHDETIDSLDRTIKRWCRRAFDRRLCLLKLLQNEFLYLDSVWYR